MPPAALGDFRSRLGRDFHVQFARIADYDFSQFLDAVEVQMLANLKTIAERRRQQPGSRRCPNQRERPQRHIDRAGINAIAQQNVDAKILHRRIEEFLDCLGKPVNFIDEQHRAFLGVGQVGDQVFGCLQHRPAGHLKRHAQIARNAGGKGGFAQTRRAIEQDMPQRVSALAGRVDRDFQPRIHVALSDHVPHVLRTQIAIVVGGRGGIL